MEKPPVIDTRDRESILEEALKLASSYVPEWKPEEGDAGIMLARLFAGLFAETAEKYNGMTANHYRYLLGLFRESPHPAVPACGYVVAEPARGALTPVPIAKGTRLYAVTEQGQRVPYEVTEGFLAAENRVESVYNTENSFDRIMAAAESEGGWRLFDTEERENLQKRRLIFSNRYLLAGQDSRKVSVRIENRVNIRKEEEFEALLSDRRAVCLEQWTEGGWQEAEWTKEEGACAAVTVREAPETGYRGRTGRFLAFRLLNADGINELSFTGIRLSCAASGIRPDCVIKGDCQVEGREIAVFGERFSAYDEFLLGCEEALSKRGARITLAFQLRFRKSEKEPYPESIYGYGKVPEGMKVKRNGERRWKTAFVHRDETAPDEPPTKAIESVCFEYWNGSGFRRLFGDGLDDGLFNGEREGKVELSFWGPEDLEPVRAAGIAGLFIRMRILSVSPGAAVGGRYLYPVLLEPEFSYSYEERPVYADALYREEDLQVREGLGEQVEKVWYRRTAGEKKAFAYLRIQNPLCPGILKAYWKLDKERKAETDEDDPITFEYYGENNGEGAWIPLTVSDRTGGLTKSGITTFVVRERGLKTFLFGEQGAFLRLVRKDGGRRICLKNIWFNAVPIVQQEKNEAEYFTAQAGEKNKICPLSEKNITELTVWVDGEEWNLTDHPGAAAADDRVYAADFREGLVIFGGGVHGRLPATTKSAQIRIEYSVSMGEAGNLDAEGICGFSDPVPYIKRVTNPERIAGGLGGETDGERLLRASDLFINQNRAVTLADYETAALWADRSIARVKAVLKHGAITVAVLPKDRHGPEEARERMERCLMDEFKKIAPAAVVREGRIRIVRVEYIEICLTIRGAIAHGASYQEVYEGILDRLSWYLDPVSGDFGGRGFVIGTLPTRARLFNYLKTVPGLGGIKSLEISCYTAEGDFRREIGYETARSRPFAVPVNGTHRIILETVES